MSGDEGFIPMQVSALAVDPVTNVPVVILADPVGGTTLPVGIGLGEAPAIAAELDGIELERPMTHQLTAALLDAAGARIVRVELRDSVRAKMSAAIVLIPLLYLMRKLIRSYLGEQNAQALELEAARSS